MSKGRRLTRNQLAARKHDLASRERAEREVPTGAQPPTIEVIDGQLVTIGWGKIRRLTQYFAGK